MARRQVHVVDLGDVRQLGYRSASGAVTSRAVEPIVLAHSHGRWYLVAWCQDRAAVRWFRMHRIEKADLTSQRYVPRDVGEVGEPPRGAAPAPL